MFRAEDDPARAAQLQRLRARLATLPKRCATCRRRTRMRPWFRHYTSSLCQHHLHDGCRLSCKADYAPCRCRCHKRTAAQMIRDTLYHVDP